jgi:hypothetical protein
MSESPRYELDQLFGLSNFTDMRLEDFADRCIDEDCAQSVIVGDYMFNTVGVDRRNIATGGASDFDYVIHQPHAKLHKGYSSPQWLSLTLVFAMFDVKRMNTVLSISGYLDRFKYDALVNKYGAELSILNSKRLLYYERFTKGTSDILPDVPYKTVTRQELEIDEDTKYDLILGWSSDMENPFLSASTYVDRLNSGGVMMIQNSSDSSFLYHNKTIVSPAWEWHHELKHTHSCRVYHIPLFYGLTIVVRD